MPILNPYAALPRFRGPHSHSRPSRGPLPARLSQGRDIDYNAMPAPEMPQIINDDDRDRS